MVTKMRWIMAIDSDSLLLCSQFADLESEARYWKSRCQDLQDTLTDTENSLHEFMDSSKELEKEMDREISAANAKRDDYQLRSEKLKGDVDDWKVREMMLLDDRVCSVLTLIPSMTKDEIPTSTL
jgi:predicted  nucleic acid-binding Zn-ribbon protein